MQNNVRVRARSDRRIDLVDDEVRRPSYFEWREQTITTVAYRPTPKPRHSALTRLLRRLAGKG